MSNTAMSRHFQAAQPFASHAHGGRQEVVGLEHDIHVLDGVQHLEQVRDEAQCQVASSQMPENLQGEAIQQQNHQTVRKLLDVVGASEGIRVGHMRSVCQTVREVHEHYGEPVPVSRRSNPSRRQSSRLFSRDQPKTQWYQQRNFLREKIDRQGARRQQWAHRRATIHPSFEAAETIAATPASKGPESSAPVPTCGTERPHAQKLMKRRGFSHKCVAQGIRWWIQFRRKGAAGEKGVMRHECPQVNSQKNSQFRF